MTEAYVLASIDPGGTTGLFMGQVTSIRKIASVQPVAMGSFRDMTDVLNQVESFQPWAVVMESLAPIPSLIARTPWHAIWEGLKKLGYHEKTFDRSYWTEKGVCTISPGLWKPIVARVPPLNVPYRFESQHEKDAFHLFHYWLKHNLQPDEVHYV